MDVEAALQIASDLTKATEELCDAIEQEASAKQVLRDAEAALKGAEAEVVFSAALEAQEKRGPLANLATTSKAYTAAIDALTWQASKTTIKPVADSARAARVAMDTASARREQAQAVYTAVKYQAQLYAALLQATV